MNSRHSQTVDLRFSQFEAKHLSMFLEQALGDIHGQRDRDAFEALQDRLADARALALWLREHVVLQLQPREATGLLEALTAQLAIEDLTPEADSSLAGVRDRLMACLPRDLAIRN